MKTIKKIIWIAAFGFAAMQASAQSEPNNSADEHNGYDRIHNQNGKQVEQIKMWLHDKAYKVEMVSDKITSLYIDGQKIPESDWNKYSDEIAAIKEQIKQNRIQAKKNEAQAKLNEIQAKRNQEQAVRNEEQAKRNQIQEQKNQEQAKLNEEQAKRNEEQQGRNQQQAQRNEERVKLSQVQQQKNQEQAMRNQEQAKRNQEQAGRNEEQEKLNQIQAKRNQEQAVRNQQQAEANERFIKSITADLVADKIIPDGDSLHKLTLNGRDMIVNGVKQPDDVYKKYAAKYKDFFNSFSGTFSFND